MAIGDDGERTRVTFPQPPLAAAAAFLLVNIVVAPGAHAPAAAPTPAVVAMITPANAAERAPAIADSRVVRVETGDTLMGLLVEAGVAPGDAQEAIVALKRVWNPRDLKVGQEITLQLAAERLQELRFTPALDRDLVVQRGEAGHFAARAEQRPLTRSVELATGAIHSSLFEAAGDAHVPPTILAEMIRAFSYDVDFQREIHPGDSFEMMFERLYDDHGNAVGAGNLVYASMTLGTTRLRLYRYTPGTAASDFFNARGESVRKALLRTPVDGARLSSGFGMRHHPILGYTKMHRGVDFAAPPGTPIMAAGDGVVRDAGWHGDYGNLVVLRHNGTFETAYAHMSRVATGLHPGQRIRQGQVIGYVGATGRATGPHLHYEIRIRGEATNPMSVKMQPGQQLAGKELVAFHSVADALDHKLLALHGQTTVVAAGPHLPE
jgi:murein DD-endopeptidase MepM/ murein hydrolase activator NlpD